MFCYDECCLQYSARMKKIRIVARSSGLSQLQVKEVMDKFPSLGYRVEYVSSFGDKNKELSLLDGESPSDMFTRELDLALIEQSADIAVHSAKDLPYPLDKRLEVVALFAPFDQTDSLVSRNNMKLSELPSNAVVGTSSQTRKKELLQIRNDLIIKGIRGTIEERVRQVRCGDYDAAIVATCALKRLGLESEISEVLPFDTHPLQGYLAVVALRERDDLKHIFDEKSVLPKQGMVSLVGFGPGNPGLLTVKGEKRLREADVIFYDDLTNREYLETFGAEKIYVGKRSGLHHVEQGEINKMLLTSARQGKNVVRLKGGDPMLFAHGGEEIEYLQSNLVHVDVVPGITTAVAAAASAKVSLTQRNIASSVSFVNGHSPNPITPESETLVYYMGAKQLQKIAESLIQQGWARNTPVLLLNNVSLESEKIFETNLQKLLSPNDYPTPLIAIVGDVAALRKTAANSVKRTLYTGLVCDNETYIHTPMIEISSVPWTIPEGSFDYLLFTSRNSVNEWFKKTDGILGARIVSICSTTTKALNDNGLCSNIEQVEYDDSYGVLNYFDSLPHKGKVLYPRSDKSLEIIPEGLKKMGFTVYPLTIYSTKIPRNVRKVCLSNIQRVIFTSPSTIDNFIEIYKELPSHIEYITRGRITENHLKEVQNEAF